MKKGGLLLATTGGKGYMGIDFFSAKLGMEFRVMNVYGPCQGKEAFWNHLLNLSFSIADNFILGGDLNFSIEFSGPWGSSAQIDPLSDTMENLLE